MVSDDTYRRTDVRTCVRAWVRACTTLGVRNGCKRIVAESTSRVQELTEFRWTRPDAASRPRRGRGWNIVHADVHVAHNVGGNAERLLLRIMSIHFVRQRMRNYESNLEEILFFYRRICRFKRSPVQPCLERFLHVFKSDGYLTCP